MRHLALLASTLALGILTGCGSAGTDPTPTGKGSMSLTAANTLLVPGLGTQLSWVVKDADGQVVIDPPVTFSTTPAGIVSVSGTGTVTGLAPGNAAITGKSAQVSATVYVSVQEGGVVTAAGATLQGLGGALTLEVPAGAVTGPVTVEFAKTSNPLLDPTADPTSTYSINTGGQGFTVPATLRLRFNPAQGPYGLPVADYRIRLYSASAWTGIPDGASDGASVASGSITGGGLYSVGWAEPGSPCVAPAYREFDFWIGAWTVTSNGNPNGLSDITATPNGCAILEYYRTLGGNVGRSISFYQPGTGLWYQTYIDDQNSRLLIAGSRSGQVMSLYTPGGSVLERWAWTIEPGGAVRQTAARSTDGGATYGAFSWNGLYTPR